MRTVKRRSFSEVERTGRVKEKIYALSISGFLNNPKGEVCP
jgi:hypothetical protein